MEKFNEAVKRNHLTGQSSLGIVIREEDIVQRLAAKGKDKLTGQALLQAKAEETLNIAYEMAKIVEV